MSCREEDELLSEEKLKKLQIDESRRLSNNGKNRRMWIIIGGVVCFLVIMMVFKSAFKSTEVGVAKAYQSKAGEPVVLLNASGYVTARRRATVAAKITGRVKEILVEEGAVVKEGDLLATLEEKDAEASLSKAHASVKVVEAQVAGTSAKKDEAGAAYERGKKLAESGFLDTQSLDKLKADYLLLESEVKTQKRQIDEGRAQARVAERELVNCEVRAPFDGIVISKDAQAGEMVSPFSAGGSYTRTGIVTIVDMSSLEIEVDVNESHLSKVRAGGKVTATLDAYPDFKIPCKVLTIIPSADRQKATVKVRIAFDSLDPRILPDMGVRTAFLRDEEISSGAVYVAKTAVRSAEGRSWVFLADGGKAEKRDVVLGEEGSDAFEVKSGLKPGDTVIVDPPEKLAGGDRIKVRNAG